MGEVLGRYHIISELGRGGMGVVYKALDPKLERFIAIKCLSDELSADEIVVARFLREARNVAALNHPNIAQIFVADEHDGKPYFVMEYVDGESLADFIDREGQCSPEMSRRVTEQAANALAAAAEEGIVHRDVKPGNIMIDRRGRAVLTDFGIACAAAEQSESGSQSIMGTPGYLPPESLSGGPVDSRSDMFALGAVWYEMITGERLMPGRDLKETFAQLARGDFPDLAPLAGKVDERVVAIIEKMLAIQPADRYADWRGVLADMAPLKTGRTGPVQRSETGPSTAEREVTAALATGGIGGMGGETARTAATATASAPEATAVIETQTNRQHPVPVAKSKPRRRGGWLAVVVLALLVLTAGAFGLARMDPERFGRLTAWMPGAQAPAEATAPVESATSSETSSASASDGSGEGNSGSPADAAGAVRASQAVASGDGDGAGQSGPVEAPENPTVESEQSPVDAGSTGGSIATQSGSGEADRAGELAESEATGSAAASEETAIEDDRSIAMAEPASNAAAETRPAEPVAAPPPRGVVVVGVGDPVIADPMVREIEGALRGGGHPLIQRNFVRGYRDYIQGDELDLAGFSDAALDAGARYVVVARALPAGERELQYYNRVETAYIAQLEAKTYDLYDMREMGASPVEQIEFTSLNATRRAVDSVRPWLDGIRDQFD